MNLRGRLERLKRRIPEAAAPRDTNGIDIELLDYATCEELLWLKELYLAAGQRFGGDDRPRRADELFLPTEFEEYVRLRTALEQRRKSGEKWDREEHNPPGYVG